MNFKILAKPTCLIKIVHIVLAIVCIGLTATELSVPVTFYNSPSSSRELMAKLEVVHATYYGFSMLSIVLVLSYLLDSPVNTKLVMVISFCATVMYIASGALHFDYYNKIPKPVRKDQILVAGIVAIINSVAYAVDIFLSWKFGG